MNRLGYVITAQSTPHNQLRQHGGDSLLQMGQRIIFKSPITGKQVPSKTLQKALHDADIDIVLH